MKHTRSVADAHTHSLWPFRQSSSRFPDGRYPISEISNSEFSVPLIFRVSVTLARGRLDD